MKWLLGSISRKIAADYASGDNGWDSAIKKRKTSNCAKRLTTDKYEEEVKVRGI
ncbi:MAG: hypothetical protein LBQ88_12750 [Treponema sp.]|nr:hypothetical protein [Treponema sp.]